MPTLEAPFKRSQDSHAQQCQSSSSLAGALLIQHFPVANGAAQRRERSGSMGRQQGKE